MAIRDIGVRTVIENLGPFLSGMDRFNKKLEQSEARMQKLADRSRKVGIALGAIAAPIIGVGFVAARTFGQFEQSMARVLAITGATAEEFATLEAAAEEMGRTTVFTAREAAGALAFMSQAGLTVNEQLSALPNVLNLAAAGQLELATAADIITNILAGQRLETSQLADATDVLVKAFTSANTNLVQLGTAFKFAGPIAAAAGVQFEEQAAILGLLGDAGIQASLAGTTLRGAVARLLNPTKEAERVLAELGVTTLDSGGNLRSFADIVADLEAGLATPQQLLELFGLRAGPGMAVLLATGSEALREFTKELETAGGTAQQVADVQLNTLQGDLTLTKSAAEGLSLTLGEALAPIIRALSRLLVPLLNFLAKMQERFPAIGITVVALGLILGALAVTLITLSFILPGLSIAFIALGGATGIAAIGAGALAIALSPITLIILGIAAAVIAGIVIWIKWKDQVLAVIDVLRLLLQVLNPIGLALTTIESFTGFNIPGIRGFAQGGITDRSGPVVAGESGRPEIIRVPANTQISPVSSVTNNFNVQATYTNPQDPQSLRLDLEALAMLTMG